MTLLNAIRRFLTPFDDTPVLSRCMEQHEDRSRRIWLIENRQASLRHEIEAARKAKKARRHLYAEQERLTRELLTLDRAG
jgi:hypothetical protein